jgi:hypothetical protein
MQKSKHKERPAKNGLSLKATLEMILRLAKQIEELTRSKIKD